MMPNNMKKFILTVLLILIGTHAFSQSEYLDPSFSIKNKSIIVLPHDEAKDGCWTNIGEVKRYIEDKLELSGAIVVQNAEDAEFTFMANVHAQRWTNIEWCYGRFEYSILKPSFADNIFSMNFIAKWDAIDVEPKNFNNAYLNWLRKRLSNLN